MRPRLHLETTIPSYLVARRSALARISTDQQTTQDWWDFRRHEYDLFVSVVVMREAAKGDAEFAGKRLAVLAGIPLLADTPESDALAERLLMGGIIPPTAAPDAFHIALPHCPRRRASDGVSPHMELRAHPQSQTRTPHRGRVPRPGLRVPAHLLAGGTSGGLSHA